MKSTESKQLNAKNVDVLIAKISKHLTRTASMEPKTTREHIIDLEGHIKGVKREIFYVKKNQDHIHKDIDKISSKMDRFLYSMLAILATGIIGFLKLH